MLNYKVILKDDIIINEFNKIDTHNDNRFNHGIKHALNVAEIMEELIKVLDIKKEDSNKYLLIACVLHDIGQVNGTDKHNLTGRVFVERYLNKKIEKVWLDKILSAIETHHEKDNIDNLSLFSHLVLFADKMDFTYKRIDKELENSFERHILDVKFEMENNVFKVLITSDKEVNAEQFLNNFKYSSKIINRIKQFSDKLKLNYEILFDSVEIKTHK